MDFTLSVIFEGLCAFVPNKPVYPYDPPYAFTVILINASRKALRRILKDELEEPPARALAVHYPRLSFDVKDLNNSPEILYRAKDIRTEGVVDLTQLDISLKLEREVPRGVELVLGFRKPGSSKPVSRWKYQKKEQERDFSWIIEMEKLWPDAALVRSDYMKSEVATSRVFVDHGILENGGLDKFNDEYMVVECVPPAKKSSLLRQAIATRVVWSVGPLTKPVSVHLTEPDSQSRAAELQFFPRSGKGNVRLRISNLCGDLLLDSTRRQYTPTEDSDFEWYFQLVAPAQRPPGIVAVPVPLRYNPSAKDSAGGRPVRCAKALFSGFTSKEIR